MSTGSVPKILADPSTPRILVDADSQPRGLGDGWASAIASFIRRRLGRKHARLEIAGLALVLLLPTVSSGLVIDDFFHRLVVERKLGVPVDRVNVFEFITANPTLRARFTELGLYPWWMGAHTQVSYWRPAAALTHFIDYAVWPRAAWLMHLENLAWYGGLVLACAALYRRFISTAWIATLAAAFYAFDHAHACPAAWVANRGALMATLFGVLALLGHDRWRVRGERRYGLLAAASFALALLSAEAGAAIAAYFFAYAVAVEQGRARQRLLSLLPYGLIAAAWRISYRVLGHGAVASGANLDPVIDPRAFVLHAMGAGPILLGSEIAGLPAEAMFEHPAWTVAASLASVALVVAFAYAVLPLLRRDASIRFFAIGAAVSVVPLAGTFPSDRYLFWVGLGMMGIAARLVAWAFQEGPRRATGFRYGFACACLLVRGVVSPLVFPLRAAGPGLLEDDFERAAESIPRGQGFDDKTVVVLSGPADIFDVCLPIVALGRGLPAPAHMYTLYAGQDDVTVFRGEASSLELRSQQGWLSRFTDRLFRDAPQHPGDTVRLAEMDAEVESVTADGRADAAKFRFKHDLNDPSLVFLAWGARGFETVQPPPPGASLTLSPAPFVLAGVMRPHVRNRPVVDDP